MKFKALSFIFIVILLIALLIVLLIGSLIRYVTKECTYPFEQDIENVASVEILELNLDTRSYSTVIELDKETATSLLNDIPSIPCNRFIGHYDRVYGIIALHIIYEDGRSEFIGDGNCAKTDENGKMHCKNYCFDFYDWYDLIYEHVDKEDVPQLEEWYQKKYKR